MECTGEIIAVGELVKDRQVGQRVIARCGQYGAFAEQVALAAADTVVLGHADTLSDAAAASLLCAHGTAHHALQQRAVLQSGETLLVLGAAGGTGLAAVQIGKAIGANVIAACSNPDKLALAKANGADEVVDYRAEDLRDRVKTLTAGRGVDVVYDPVGGELTSVCSRLIARKGRLLVIGFSSGEIAKLPLNLPLVKEYSIVGVFWGNFVQHEPSVHQANCEELLDWYRRSLVSVSIDRQFDLCDTAKALRWVMDRQVKGKVAVVPA